MGRRSQYPEEFRLRAAQLVRDSKGSIRAVAAELGINHKTLGNWPGRGAALGRLAWFDLRCDALTPPVRYR